MSDGRTYWWGKDAGWWRRERIVTLGEEFGSDGPAVIDWLACEAKAQNDGGKVKAGVRSLARGCFVEAVTVRHVLDRAVTIGLLDDFDESDGLFTCRVSGWQKDQERSRAAGRQAAARAKRNGSTEEDPPESSPPGGSVTDRDESPPVTPRHGASPIQERTGQESTASLAPSSHPASGPERAENDQGPDLADTVEAVYKILAGCSRFDVNEIATRNQIANAVGAVGGATHDEAVQAAHKAVVWRENPDFRQSNPGAVFLEALRNGKRQATPKDQLAARRPAAAPTPGKYDQGRGQRRTTA